jgi:hypothetical protein
MKICQSSARYSPNASAPRLCCARRSPGPREDRRDAD